MEPSSHPSDHTPSQPVAGSLEDVNDTRQTPSLKSVRSWPVNSRKTGHGVSKKGVLRHPRRLLGEPAQDFRPEQEEKVYHLKHPPSFGRYEYVSKKNYCIRRNRGEEVAAKPTTYDNTYQYLVVGVWGKFDDGPKEAVIRVKDPGCLFQDVFWGILRLRGWKGLLSIKKLKSFALYTCDGAGNHERIKFSDATKDTLYELFLAYNTWGTTWRFTRTDVRRKVNRGWTMWIHEALNNRSFDPLLGELIEPELGERHQRGTCLSLELVYEWPIKRFPFIVLFPVILSLAVGLGINSTNWSDAATIQTAWTVASYIATAGAVTGALLSLMNEQDNASV